jgi:hypothetical protein
VIPRSRDPVLAFLSLHPSDERAASSLGRRGSVVLMSGHRGPEDSRVGSLGQLRAGGLLLLPDLQWHPLRGIAATRGLDTHHEDQ